MPTLLSLPREMRDEIIDQVILSSRISNIDRAAIVSIDDWEERKFPSIGLHQQALGLLCTNRQLHAETMERARNLNLPLELNIFLDETAYGHFSWSSAFPIGVESIVERVDVNVYVQNVARGPEPCLPSWMFSASHHDQIPPIYDNLVEVFERMLSQLARGIVYPENQHLPDIEGLDCGLHTGIKYWGVPRYAIKEFRVKINDKVGDPNHQHSKKPENFESWFIPDTAILAYALSTHLDRDYIRSTELIFELDSIVPMNLEPKIRMYRSHVGYISVHNGRDNTSNIDLAQSVVPMVLVDHADMDLWSTRIAEAKLKYPEDWGEFLWLTVDQRLALKKATIEKLKNECRDARRRSGLKFKP
jgi:hypothetical protein